MTEEALFELKQKFLRDIPHPKLILKQIERLKVHDPEQFESVDFEPNQPLREFLKEYIDAILDLKLKVSRAQEANVLSKQLIVLRCWQLELINKLSHYCPEREGVPDDEIKQSDPFDAYAYLKELNVSEIQENEIKNYLCARIDQDPDAYSELLNGVLRARKIVEYGR